MSLRLILRRTTTAPSCGVHTRSLSTRPTAPDAHPFLSQINLEAEGARRQAQQPHLGPFPLPSSTTTGGGPTLSAQEREAQVAAASKKWRQLNGSQKVGFAAQQGSALLVVLAGGSLALLVLYATGSELFSEASPTKIFEDTTERVKASEELATILIPPYSFHGANSSNRMRRQRRISHQLTHDQDGNEVMLVRFWVEAQEPKPADGQDAYWWDTVKSYVGPLIWEDSNKPGSFTPQPTHPKPAPPPPEPEPPQSWGAWAASELGSVFGGLVPRLAKGPDGQATTGGAAMFKRARKPSLGEFSTGEATAELKKDPTTGHFVYQQLYVSIPDARHPNAYRVDIPTAVVEEPQKGMDRLRFWRKKTYVAV